MRERPKGLQEAAALESRLWSSLKKGMCNLENENLNKLDTQTMAPALH